MRVDKSSIPLSYLVDQLGDGKSTQILNVVKSSCSIGMYVADAM